MATGKRAGSRRAAKPRPRLRPDLLGLAVGITLAMGAWGYLVFVAIQLGTEARDGRSQAWIFVALAMVGAIACLFVALMFLARLTRALGITSPTDET